MRRSSKDWMLHRLVGLLACLVATALPAAAEPAAPSFDCRKAGTASERLVCSSDELAALDRQLGEAFKALRLSAADDRKSDLSRQQQRWLRDVRDGCAETSGKQPADADRLAALSCLSARYRVRISELSEMPDDRTGQDAVRQGGPDLPAETSADDARLTLVRIQSTLERIAADRQLSAVSESGEVDRLERLAEAYAHFLSNDFRAMDDVLEAVRGEFDSRKSSLIDGGDGRHARDYFDRIDMAAASPSALPRLLAGLRRVDGILFLESARPLERSADLKERTVSSGFAYNRSRLDGTWLKLPCRTIIGRAGEFAAARRELGDHSGDLLACPTEKSDFTEIEALARDASRLEPRVPEPQPAAERPATTPAPPPPPWSRAAAIAHMGERPDLARPVLEAASREDALGKLDYALFLYAFDPDGAQRNSEISSLLNQITGLATPDDGPPPSISDTSVVDPEGLIGIIRFASETSIANSDSAFYAIPCAILVARPELLAATEPYWGSNRDNFLPRSGCAWDRGAIDGFPEQEARAFMAASEAANGDFIDNFDGSAKFGHIKGQEATLQAAALAPRFFLDQPEPKLDYPYQTWGVTGLSAYHTSRRIKAVYEQAHAHLGAYYVRRGMSGADSTRAAKTALFRLAFGAECGRAAPGDSTRAMILTGASPSAIIARLRLPHAGESPSVLACSDTADIEPVVHVAVEQPTVLEHLLMQGSDVDAWNSFRKTPLMVAAQFDLLDSARILLSRNAPVRVVTWQGPDAHEATLYHDARSALMYAAANASLPMIRLLMRAGADPYQADSKGRRAVDYLLGFGPTAANPKLTPAERAEAVRLLY